jgi:hypothetical protein
MDMAHTNPHNAPLNEKNSFDKLAFDAEVNHHYER